VESSGTLLQIAVYDDDKRDFVRFLLDHGVDPTSVCDANQATPMEIAVTEGRTEVFKMLAEVTEITGKVKLMQLSNLIGSDKPKDAKEEFQNQLKSVPVDLVSRTNVSGNGTLLQNAVGCGSQDFAKILLEFGVDPAAVCEGKPSTPMDIAVENENEEMLRLLADFTEMPDHIKLYHLSKLMNRGQQKAKEKEEFKKILSSLSVELVNKTNVAQTTNCPQRGPWRSNGNLLQDAVDEGKKDFVRILLEFGADPYANTDEMEKTPMAIAVEKDNFEVLIVLAGFAEVPAEMKLDFLRMILEHNGQEDYAAEFKKNLEGLSMMEVLEKRVNRGWHLTPDNPLSLNLLQFAALMGKTECLQHLLDHGLDPDAHVEDSPTAVELAAVNGHINTFAALTAILKIDPEWFQMAQLLVWGMSGDKSNHCHNWKPSEKFKELLGRIPADKLSKESVCRSTLLQDFAWNGNRSAVALLLQHGADPTVTTVHNPKLPERWAYEFNHVGVLAELVKVKEVEQDIMSSSLGELVLKEEEREWRRRKEEEEREWRMKMLQQQQEWQKEVVGMLKQQNQLISLLAKSSSDADQEQDNDANISD